MRKLTIILLLISHIACNHQKTEKSESHIEKFERLLGEQETIYLNEIVAIFDDFLASTYPNQKSKFKSYLVDISESKINDFWKIDSIKLKKYCERNLFGKYDMVYPDSVWFDGQAFCIKYPDYEFTEKIIPKRKNVDLNIDSIINSYRIEPRFLLKEKSKFYIALESIQQSDSLINKYLDAKEATENLPPSLMAGGLKYYLTENNEYFAKRIFIMDIYER